MIILWVALFVRVSECYSSSEEEGGARGRYSTVSNLVPIEELDNVAGHHDAQHRGPKWYDDSSGSTETEIDTSSDAESSSSSYSFVDESSSASSFETTEKKRRTRTYRVCTPCPHDMMKNYKNLGIKWLCGGYQRARRSFKSECMMRYRNCEDGTLFVKLYDHRCRDDPFHGHHFFYDYKTK